MHSGGTRRVRASSVVAIVALVLVGVGCGGGGGDDEAAAPTEVQLVAPGGGRDPVTTTTTEPETTTTAEPETTTTTEPETTTTVADVDEPVEEGGVAAEVVDQANFICGSRQYVNAAGGDQPDAIGALLPVTEAVVVELRPLAEAGGGRFLEAVQNLDLAIAFSQQEDGREQAADAYGSAASAFATLGMDQCAAQPG